MDWKRIAFGVSISPFYWQIGNVSTPDQGTRIAFGPLRLQWRFS